MQGKRIMKGMGAYLFLLALVFLMLTPSRVMAGTGDFDLSQHNIPLKDILSGGPPKDGIPAILKPEFLTAHEATYLKENDRILGMVEGTTAKAYPVNILNWHEIVNDRINGKPVVVTFCPLCGTGIAFAGSIKGREMTFGVSGLLYQSDLLMYDHQTESLWSQISMEAVAGPLTGIKLHHLFLEHTTWGEWRRAHPQTLVLSRNTGYHRNYNRDPYLGYAQRAEIMFPTNHSDARYHPKEWVVGVEVGGVSKAYPFAELRQTTGVVRDTVNGTPLTVLFQADTQSAKILDAKGTPFPSVMAYWFAWVAFHPDTKVFTAQ